MMSRKTLSTWAIIMIVVFGGLVILYPMLFHSEDHASPAAGGARGPMNPPNLPAPPAPPVPPVR